MPLLYWYMECMVFAFGMGAVLGSLATGNLISVWGIGSVALVIYGLYRLLRDMPAMWRYVFPPRPRTAKERIQSMSTLVSAEPVKRSRRNREAGRRNSDESSSLSPE